MNVMVNVTRAELAEMETSESQLKQSIINALDHGLEDDDGTLYLSGFNVEIQVTD